MKYRTLGRTGINVSVLGFGCMRLPTLGAPGPDRRGCMPTRLLHDAIEKGVNYVDTAWFYHATKFGQPGQSEPFVGRALSGGWRDRVLLATKLPQQIIKTREEMDWLSHRSSSNGSRRTTSTFTSCTDLTGQSWDRMRDLGVREFLAERAANAGSSAFRRSHFTASADDFPRIIDEYDGWAFGQLQYNYMDTDYQAGYSGLRYAAEKGVGVVVMEPLKGGRLAKNLPPEMQAVFDKRPRGLEPRRVGPAIRVERAGRQPPAFRDERSCAAGRESAGGRCRRPGALTPEHLAVYDAARAAMRARTKADCTACRYCMPCEQGVEIPELLAALNAAAMWDTKDPWLTGYTRIAGKPDACIECGKCEDICPQATPDTCAAERNRAHVRRIAASIYPCAPPE